MYVVIFGTLKKPLEITIEGQVSNVFQNLSCRAPAQSVALQTLEQEVAISISAPANVLSDRILYSFLSQLSIVSTTVMWESSQWHGKNIAQSTG